jgi:hypothetical protein
MVMLWPPLQRLAFLCWLWLASSTLNTCTTPPEGAQATHTTSAALTLFWWLLRLMGRNRHDDNFA